MSWKDTVSKQATFRGVAFYVESSDRGGGRRSAKHEYPKRDAPFVEDMGLKSRSFTVEGHVIGEDYLTARDALITALETSGVGELVHPYHGTRSCQVETFKVKETVDKGGIANFSIEFLETPAQPALPTSVPDTAGTLLSSASDTSTVISSEFTVTYLPGTRTESLNAMLGNVTDAVQSAVSTLTLDAQTLAQMNLRIATLQADAVDLVVSPSELLASLTDLFGSFVSGSETALLALYYFNPGIRPPATTYNRQVEQTNYDALQRVIQRLIVIQLATLATVQTFDSYETAVTQRDAITDLLDDQAEIATDDTYPVLMQLRADLVKAIPGESGDLPHLLTVTHPVTLPSLVIAHQLYGNVDLEQDLIARNRVRNPLLVRGGTALQVLSNE